MLAKQQAVGGGRYLCPRCEPGSACCIRALIREKKINTQHRHRQAGRKRVQRGEVTVRTIFVCHGLVWSGLGAGWPSLAVLVKCPPENGRHWVVLAHPVMPMPML